MGFNFKKVFVLLKFADIYNPRIELGGLKRLTPVLFVEKVVYGPSVKVAISIW